MTSAEIPEGRPTTRKRGTNRINFLKGICLDAYFQRKPKIIANVLQHICISGI
jgi:hypothetical protein